MSSLEEQNNDALSPAIRRLLAEHNLEASAIKERTGVGGRLTREDVEKHLAKGGLKAPAVEPAAAYALGARGETRANDPPGKRVAERRLLESNSHRHADDLQ